jgi:hypothetical protein
MTLSDPDRRRSGWSPAAIRPATPRLTDPDFTADFTPSPSDAIGAAAPSLSSMRIVAVSPATPLARATERRDQSLNIQARKRHRDGLKVPQFCGDALVFSRAPRSRSMRSIAAVRCGAARCRGRPARRQRWTRRQP